MVEYRLKQVPKRSSCHEKAYRSVPDFMYDFHFECMRRFRKQAGCFNTGSGCHSRTRHTSCKELNDTDIKIALLGVRFFLVIYRFSCYNILI